MKKIKKNLCNSPSPEHPCLCSCHPGKECQDCLCGRHKCQNCVPPQTSEKGWEIKELLEKEREEFEKKFKGFFDEPGAFEEVQKFIIAYHSKLLHAVKEELESLTHYYRSKHSPDCSRGESDEEKSTEMLVKSDILQILEAIN